MDSTHAIPDLTYEIYRDRDELLSVFAGKLRLGNSEAARRLLALSFIEGIGRVYLKTTGLIHIDSAGLGVIMGTHLAAKRESAQIVIIQPTSQQISLLKTFRLNNMIPVKLGMEAEELRQRLMAPNRRLADPPRMPEAE